LETIFCAVVVFVYNALMNGVCYMRPTAILKTLAVLLVIVFWAGSAAAWEKEYIEKLQAGKEQSRQLKTEGLAYTPAEETVLEEAIIQAMDEKASPCEAMKIAVDLEYNPYLTIKHIYGYGGEVGLNQVCMCATEAGIQKQIVARAAADAITPLGEPVYERDEIAQSQCINQTGLAYTEAVMPLTIIPGGDTPIKPFSAGSITN